MPHPVATASSLATLSTPHRGEETRDMTEAIAEIMVLIEFGMMTVAQAERVLARWEDAR